MIKAIDVVTKVKEAKKIEAIKDYKKCTACGLYGTKEEIITDVVVDDSIYVDICHNCYNYLEQGGKIKKRKYFTEEIEEFL